MDLIEKITQGDVLTIARLITKVEKNDPDSIKIIKEIYSKSGRAHLVGITGPPGAGKSCLVSALVKQFREENKTVGVLAVDPSSPLTGGAFLGDRARMDDLSRDEGIFIRSLASRGASGGLSEAVSDAADILDVAGKDIIIIETVGVGQGEIEITKIAHTVILVLVPGYGDTLQALKAGILEVADIVVVNKADLPDSQRAYDEITSMHRQKFCEQNEDCWQVPIIKTSAHNGTGVDELSRSISGHFKYLAEHKALHNKNSDRRTRQFLDILTRKVRDEFLSTLKTDPKLQKWVKGIGDLKLDPYTASEQVIEMFKQSRGGSGR